MAKVREWEAEVIGVRHLTDEVMEIDLRVDSPAGFAFQAGQSISVSFEAKVERAFSVASSPTRRDGLTLCADAAPGGVASQWLRALEVGQRVRFKGPSGAFVFNRADARRALFVAEEIGIVPVRSILAHLYETGYGRPNGLIYWARDPSRLLYDTGLRSLARRYPAFSYLPALREPPATWRGERGEPAEVVDRLVHSVDRLIVYVCGGGDTIDRVRQVLVGKGMDRKAVRGEKLWG